MTIALWGHIKSDIWTKLVLLLGSGLSTEISYPKCSIVLNSAMLASVTSAVKQAWLPIIHGTVTGTLRTTDWQRRDLIPKRARPWRAGRGAWFWLRSAKKCKNLGTGFIRLNRGLRGWRTGYSVYYARYKNKRREYQGNISRILLYKCIYNWFDTHRGLPPPFSSTGSGYEIYPSFWWCR